MEVKLTKLQAAKNVFAILGLTWKESYDGTNGSTVTADAWRDLHKHLKKTKK